MNVHVHIDRLVVHDAALSRREREALAPSIQRELIRLQGRTAEPDRGHPLATQIAAAIHRQVTDATGPEGTPR